MSDRLIIQSVSVLRSSSFSLSPSSMRRRSLTSSIKLYAVLQGVHVAEVAKQGYSLAVQQQLTHASPPFSLLFNRYTIHPLTPMAVMLTSGFCSTHTAATTMDSGNTTPIRMATLRVTSNSAIRL